MNAATRISRRDHTGKAAAETFDGSVKLALENEIVLALLIALGHLLPRQNPADEVNQNVAESLKVVATGLLHAVVGIDTGKANRARDLLVVPERNVLPRELVLVRFRQSKVDQIYYIESAPGADNEIVRLQIAVQVQICMNMLDSRDLLFI